LSLKQLLVIEKKDEPSMGVPKSTGLFGVPVSAATGAAMVDGFRPHSEQQKEE
jgi:hypothetical protein